MTEAIVVNNLVKRYRKASVTFLLYFYQVSVKCAAVTEEEIQVIRDVFLRPGKSGGVRIILGSLERQELLAKVSSRTGYNLESEPESRWQTTQEGVTPALLGV